MSVRVPVMTIGSDSGAGVGDDSWPSQIDVARNETKKNSERLFCTSNPPVSRGELAAEPFAPLSFFFFAKKFFRGPSRTGGFRNRFTAKTQTHEVRIWVQRHAGE